MRRLGLILIVGSAAAFIGGCSGESKTAIDTAAPPPGPNANLNPKTKLNMNKRGPAAPGGVPAAPGGMPGTSGTEGPTTSGTATTG